MYVTLGICYENKKENKIGIPVMGTFSTITHSEFEAEILGLSWEKYDLSFDTKNVLLPVEPWGMKMRSA